MKVLLEEIEFTIIPLSGVLDVISTSDEQFGTEIDDGCEGC